MESFKYEEHEDECGKKFCCLRIDGVGGIVTTIDKLEGGIMAAFISSLMCASIDKDDNKINEILETYEEIEKEFL